MTKQRRRSGNPAWAGVKVAQKHYAFMRKVWIASTLIALLALIATVVKLFWLN